MTVIREFLSTVFIVNKRKVLLNFNNKCKIWVPVGGHIECNELPCVSVVRETKEETGLDIELISPYDKSKTRNLVQPAHVHLDHIKDDHKHINLMYFGVVKGGEFKKVADDGAPSKWFSKDEVVNEEMPDNIREWALEALNRLGDKY